MKVGELKKALAGFDEEAEVIASVGSPIESMDYPLEDVTGEIEGKVYILILAEEIFTE